MHWHQWSIITCVRERDTKLQSCGGIPSVINYNLFVRERVRKKEITKYNLIKTKNLRKEGRITTWSKQGREWERKQERSRSKWGEREREKERKKQSNKREEWAEIRRSPKFIFTLFICPGTSSPLSHHITSHNICLHIYLSQIKLYAIAYEL